MSLAPCQHGPPILGTVPSGDLRLGTVPRRPPLLAPCQVETPTLGNMPAVGMVPMLDFCQFFDFFLIFCFRVEASVLNPSGARLLLFKTAFSTLLLGYVPGQ